MRLCECCGQPLPEIRHGVKLSPLKARIFDIVDRAGPDGVHSDELHAMVFEKWQTKATLKTHIWQINEMIFDEGYRIKGTDSFYTLRKINA